MTEWIEEQAAIDTLIELDGLQVGDEIIFKRPDGVPAAYGWGLANDGDVFVVTPEMPDWGNGSWDYSGSSYPIIGQVQIAQLQHVLLRENIKAWRRPAKT